LYNISRREPSRRAPILKWPRAPQMKIRLRSHQKRIIVSNLSLVYIRPVASGEASGSRLPHLKSVPPISRLAPRLQHTSNTVFLKCGPPFGFWSPLLLNPCDGPGLHNNIVHGRNFVVKCGGTAWCETNIVIGSTQK